MVVLDFQWATKRGKRLQIQINPQIILDIDLLVLALLNLEGGSINAFLLNTNLRN